MATQRRSLVGCGTAEIMLQSQIRQMLEKLQGVISIAFKNDKNEKSVVVTVASEAHGQALPKSYLRRKINYVVVAPPPKPAPCLIGNKSPGETAARNKIRGLLTKRKGVVGIEFKDRSEVVVRVKTKADGEALPKTCQRRKVSYKVVGTIKAGPAKKAVRPKPQ